MCAVVPVMEPAEPPPLRPWSYPEVTRLLLTFDGSANRLLASLVGSPVRAVVDGQQPLVPAVIPSAVREALAGEGGAVPLLLRRCRLVTPQGVTVSSSRIYLPARQAESLLPSPGVPLLHHLAQQQLALSCRPVSFAPRRWSYGAGRQWSVGRDYLVDCRGGTRIWVSEQFSPDCIPPAAAPGLGTAPDLTAPDRTPPDLTAPDRTPPAGERPDQPAP
ncbi:hypothetical protein ABH930_000582 [Kitasatospora sp. GAS204A]|nr:hypothetical protein [Kitasatospora sp. GAS204B]